MSHITVIFTRRRHIGSVVLRAWLHSRFSHCAFVDTDTGTVIEAVGWYGVRERSLTEMQEEASHFELVQIPCRDPQGVLAAARSQLGKPYDWLGILGFWFRRNWHSNNAFLCSELIAWGLEAVREPLFRREAHRISPDHIYLPLFNR